MTSACQDVARKCLNCRHEYPNDPYTDGADAARTTCSPPHQRIRSTLPRRSLAIRCRPPRAASPIGDEPVLSRNVIIEHASETAKTMPLDQISRVQLATESGVPPGLIRYYLGSRDDLISGVLNGYYRKRLERLPALPRNRRSDIEHIGRVESSLAREMPEISLCVVSHNRFRLFQSVAPGEVDYGVALVNHTTFAFFLDCFAPEHAALAYHLLAQYLLS
jgi:AcrR family transcriptional regulator